MLGRLGVYMSSRDRSIRLLSCLCQKKRLIQKLHVHHVNLHTGTIRPFHRNKFVSLTSMFLKTGKLAALISWISWNVHEQRCEQQPQPPIQSKYFYVKLPSFLLSDRVSRFEKSLLNVTVVFLQNFSLISIVCI